MSEIERNIESNVIEGNQINENNFNEINLKEKDIFEKITGIVIIIVICETIFGVISNSISLLADSCRLFVDIFMYFNLSKNVTKKQKFLESLFVFIGIVLAITLAVLYIIISTKRLYSNDIKIDSTNMLVGGFLAILANIGMCIVHASDIFKPRRYTLLSDFISIRLQQSCHIFINHGLGFIVFISALLIYIDKYYIFTDSISAIVMSILILSNTLAIINKYQRYFIKKYSYIEISSTNNE
ncbi:Cation efflux protein family and Cation efflux protein transmembrane domain-containing protein [Strongyloides ratti]|uniref:Cation efflux protein family and Cation efflux protein transmembrane domain-containing protein n=1 Tax=Strongyloides ratti TaxID=34506 RepID=A0A090KQL3_STRRB|nr:Cation efflux protein family and Cation efflux protein transmembrane domain-containing protein [Strongyloides ratti]CEF59818.1 Cation efflux protein family and Cation efflux protein transmembrane domain-containing protein [Strongyloides ratti]